MFRIKKIFENKLTTILRIEGDISNENLVVLKKEISTLLQESEQQVILDGSTVSFVTPKAVGTFTEMFCNNIYLLNFPTNFRNILHSAGWSDRVLE